MTPMTDAIAAKMTVYRAARGRGDTAAAWAALEHVHILSQPAFGAHLRSHVAMLGFAMAQRDGRELAGQLMRLALVPLASLTGRLPIGNTGRARVSAFAPMPVPADLQAILDQAAP